ncbi:MAG TPA: enoyl-CoA hydratase/isomerase family protein [Nevskia sp.]|nr:enoyl-CoA hydratase/isomerase family protein [Nevskia sp.]
MSDFDLGDVRVTLLDFVAQVEMRRPPHNFFDATLVADLATALERLDADPDCRATLLCAEGKSFCAGADFSSPRIYDEQEGTAKLYANAVRLFAVRKPIVAAIEGAAIGGGLGLALAADFRVACPEARFSANFVKLGTHAGFGITHTLPALIGRQRASLMLLTGRRLTGAAAFEWGLVDVLVEPAAVRTAARDLALEMAANAPLAVVATRETMRDGLAEAVRLQTGLEFHKQNALFDTEDHREGVAAVAQRRPGKFSGR